MKGLGFARAFKSIVELGCKAGLSVCYCCTGSAISLIEENIEQKKADIYPWGTNWEYLVQLGGFPNVVVIWEERKEESRRRMQQGALVWWSELRLKCHDISQVTSTFWTESNNSDPLVEARYQKMHHRIEEWFYMTYPSSALDRHRHLNLEAHHEDSKQQDRKPSPTSIRLP